ncbi:jg10428 [Pararge aegeria aegeria]|uniref:Jg10428 protein n=1 Tax=Pararge aegeria aegeria TaxID=348720 RepID=A0A8S4RCA4_9NEOP|nr:jg10428 [Pararge aegeria aegeria]
MTYASETWSLTIGLIRRLRVTQRVMVLRCWNGDPAPVNSAYVGPQGGGPMTSGESFGAAGGKRPRTVYRGTPYKRPMSSCGRQLVE